MKRTWKPWWQNCMLVADEFRTRLGRSFESGKVDYSVRSALRLGDLEPRLLFSATPIDVSELVGADSPDSTVMVAIVEEANLSESTSLLDLPSQSGALSIEQKTREIVFIDSAVPDLSSLLDDLSRSNRNFEVFVLDSNRDGVEQISEVLQNRSDISSLHVVSHSENNAIKLGNVWLGESNLDGYAGQIAWWKAGLAADADILLYGCDLASNESGRSFVEALSELTGADVAASVDDTGHHRYQGDWDLEFNTGTIETGVAFSSQLQNEWLGKLATITVNTFADDWSLNSQLSLREAIWQANLGGGGDTIVLSSGTYLLTRSGSEEFASAGDLDIRSTITIQGAGVGQTIIDGGGIDRVFELRTNLANLTLTGLTVRGGSVNGFGGGIHVQHADATLTLQNVLVSGNVGTEGAGIYSLGTVSLNNVVLSNNGDASTVKGGGIYIDGDATLNQVTIYDNQADSGGGIYNDGDNVSLTNVTVSGNTASSSGGGLYNTGDISITSSTFAYNTADSAGGIGLHGGGTLSLLNTIVSDNVGTSANPDLQGTINSLGFNLIENPTGGSGFVSSDITGSSARLGALGNNGGTTPTHSLSLGSAAINAGTSVGVPATDQRGVARLAATDIGAFEFTSVPFAFQGETLVNSSNGDEQRTVADGRGSAHGVSLAADGSYVVVWTSLNQDGSGEGVYARRFDATGAALTGEILVNESTANDQKWARVASQADGSFVVTWTSNHEGDQNVYFRRFNANGTPATAEVRVNTTNTLVQKNSDIGMNAFTGDFVIVWQGNGGQLGHVDDNGVFGQRYSSNGSAIGDEFRVNSATLNNQGDASVSVNRNGEFVVVWDDEGGMHFQRYDSSGVVVGSRGTSDASISAGNGSVALNDDGSFVVVWRQGAVGAKDVYLKRYDNNGDAVGAVQPVAVADSTALDQSNPSIAMDASGDFIVVWDGNGTQVGQDDASGVFGQKFLADGTRVGNEFRINTTTVGAQDQASIAMVGINHFVVVWSGSGDQSGQEDSFGVFSRQFSETSQPSDIVLSNVTVAENALGAAIGNVVVVDADAGDTHVWSVSDTRFEVVGNQLKLRAGQSLNFESEATVNLTLTVTDQGGAGLAYNEAFVVQVANVNEVSTDITLSSVIVDENASGAVIGNVGVVDPDTADTHVWSVSDTRFEVVGNQLKLKAGQSLDFETETTVNLTLTVTDQAGSGLSYDEAFVVQVANVNDVSTDITLSSVTVAENSPGAVIGNVGVVDPDTADTHLWSVSDTRFEVVGNQLKLKAGQSLDFESEATVNLMVTVTDQAGSGLAFDESFVVQVTNVNEVSTDITLSNAAVAENASGAVIGNVGVVDPDTADTHVWSVSDTRFEVVGNQLKLKAGQSLDFESEATVNLTVTVTDQAGSGLAYDEAFAVQVTNVNEVSTDITLSNATVAENASGAVIGNVGVVDPDTADTHVWSVSDTRFEVVGNQLKLKAGQSLDFESEPTVNVTLTVTDQAGSGLTYSEVFAILTTNTNESPLDIQISRDELIERTLGAAVGNLTVIDPDHNDLHSYTISDSRFEVVANQLRLRSDQVIDWAQESSISVVITVVDQLGLSYNESLTIHVVNQNLAPTGITLSSNSVQGNSLAAVVGNLSVIDPNTEDTHQLTVNDQRFEIVNGVLKLKRGQSLASHLEPTLNLTITATDDRGQSHSTVVTIAVLPPQVINLPNPEPTAPPSNSSTSDATRQAESSVTSQEKRASEGDAASDSGSTADPSAASSPSGIVLMMGGANQAMLSGAVNLVSMAAANLSLQSSVNAGASEQEALGEGNQDVSGAQSGGFGSQGPSAVAQRFSEELRRLGIGDLQSIAFQSTDALLMSSGEMWQELDQQMDKVESQIQGDLIVIGAAGAAASSFTAGLVAWGLRTGFLASGLLAQMPAWRAFDPLLIMQGAGEGDDESLEDLMKRRSDELDHLESDGETA